MESATVDAKIIVEVTSLLIEHSSCVIKEKMVEKTKSALIEQTALKKDGGGYRTMSSVIFTEGAGVWRGGVRKM